MGRGGIIAAIIDATGRNLGLVRINAKVAEVFGVIQRTTLALAGRCPVVAAFASGAGEQAPGGSAALGISR
jgi:hypothetical protein